MTSLTSPDVSIPTTLHGHCHCRSIAFTATPPTPLTSYAECDCSICFRKAYRWTFISEASFKLENGDDANKKLKEYTFGAGGLVHTFCATCGCAVFAMQKEKGMVGVNLRMVDDIDFSKLSKQEFKGTSIPPPYKPITQETFPGELPAACGDGGGDGKGNAPQSKLYTGSCHCQAVTLALRCLPLPEEARHAPPRGVAECDCSICRRTGRIGLLAQKTQLAITGSDRLSTYRFGSKDHAHHFCGTCGVHVTIELFDSVDSSHATKEGWSEEKKMMAKHLGGLVGVNLRLLEGVEWADIEVKQLPGSKF